MPTAAQSVYVLGIRPVPVSTTLIDQRQKCPRKRRLAYATTRQSITGSHPEQFQAIRGFHSPLCCAGGKLADGLHFEAFTARGLPAALPASSVTRCLRI